MTKKRKKRKGWGILEKPIVSFITFNRAGLVATNLLRLLETKEDFELYIVDNGSIDDTWQFIESLKDARIKEKKRFEVNKGGIYALNYVLSHRKPGQYFVNIDCDVYLHTDNWLSIFLQCFQTFPQMGLIASTPYKELQGDESRWKLTKKDGMSIYELPAVIGCCICIRPEVFEMLGYFCEETCGADLDFPKRMRLYTPYKMGAVPMIKMEQKYVTCDACPMRDLCTYKTNQQCYLLYQSRYYNQVFYQEMIIPKSKRFYEEIEQGKRSFYCASIHDPDSLQKYYYDYASAEENFDFYTKYVKQ